MISWLSMHPIERIFRRWHLERRERKERITLEGALIEILIQNHPNTALSQIQTQQQKMRVGGGKI